MRRPSQRSAARNRRAVRPPALLIHTEGIALPKHVSVGRRLSVNPLRAPRSRSATFSRGHSALNPFRIHLTNVTAKDSFHSSSPFFPGNKSENVLQKKQGWTGQVHLRAHQTSFSSQQRISSLISREKRKKILLDEMK